MLPHETCGTHLDSRQRTIDYELEKKNFKSAGDILAEIWSKIELDGHPVVKEHVEKKEIDPIELNEMWMSNHCRTSKYFFSNENKLELGLSRKISSSASYSCVKKKEVQQSLRLRTEKSPITLQVHGKG